MQQFYINLFRLNVCSLRYESQFISQFDRVYSVLLKSILIYLLTEHNICSSRNSKQRAGKKTPIDMGKTLTPN